MRNINKLVLTVFFTVLPVLSFAGGIVAADPVEHTHYFYSEANVGVVDQDWRQQAANAVNAALPTSDGNVRGNQSGGASTGITYGADFGYMFNQYFGLEMGWAYLPRFVTTPFTGFILGNSVLGSIQLRNTGATWAAFKWLMPLTENFDAFFKAGISYKYGSIVFNCADQVPDAILYTK